MGLNRKSATIHRARWAQLPGCKTRMQARITHCQSRQVRRNQSKDPRQELGTEIQRHRMAPARLNQLTLGTDSMRTRITEGIKRLTETDTINRLTTTSIRHQRRVLPKLSNSSHLPRILLRMQASTAPSTDHPQATSPTNSPEPTAPAISRSSRATITT